MEKWCEMTAETRVKTLATLFYRETFYNTQGKKCDILSIKERLIIYYLDELPFSFSTLR